MSGMNVWVALALTVLFVALSGVFVAAQFSLVAARRNRLARHPGVGARAGVRALDELSLMVAAAQLGITLCTLALGAVSKPAVHHTLEPLLGTALPPVAASAAAFTLALVLVTFVHLVVGEMAPKSWAISAPERSVRWLALPMRAFLWCTRPLLVALEALSLWCLRRVGVDLSHPAGAGVGPEAVRELADHSVAAGVLEAGRRDRLASTLEVNALPLSEAAEPVERIASVGPQARVDEIVRVCRESTHLRLVVMESGRVLGKVHVRQVLGRDASTTAREVMRPVLSLQEWTPVSAAVGVMRESRSHLCLVRGADGSLTGLVTLGGVLDRLWSGGRTGPADS
ncbi:DUF21 domain-containing protein [Nocardiopsis sp. HNM0947]|uniref:DUF21 domain-containing protein n=1 Tax=Nocardiopsis coralli TaxID=2772213 RepID=A0ABR9PCN6_9ACTN|nr:CNNM domain-containing protein [Nocardiopsis coralli]MBE3001600.1 DUF21 domain-containing protein [Nocardiopsis coralli]